MATENRRKTIGDIFPDSLNLVIIETVDIAEPRKWYEFLKPKFPTTMERRITGPLGGDKDTTIIYKMNPGWFNNGHVILTKSSRRNLFDENRTKDSGFTEFNKWFEDLYKNAGYEFHWPDYKPVNKNGGNLNYLNFFK